MTERVARLRELERLNVKLRVDGSPINAFEGDTLSAPLEDFQARKGSVPRDEHQRAPIKPKAMTLIESRP